MDVKTPSREIQNMMTRFGQALQGGEWCNTVRDTGLPLAMHFDMHTHPVIGERERANLVVPTARLRPRTSCKCACGASLHTCTCARLTTVAWQPWIISLQRMPFFVEESRKENVVPVRLLIRERLGFLNANCVIGNASPPKQRKKGKHD